MTIKAVSADIEQEARHYQNTLTKPPGALGKLEDIACWFAARQGKAVPSSLQPHIAVFAADHGVAAEGISAFPSVVTGEMVKNFARGGAAINVLAKQSNASLDIIDVGILVDTSSIPGIQQHKVQAGTHNLLYQAAMSEQDCQQAKNIGKHEAKQAIEQGANILIAGDMGIGNTTASACLISLFTQQDPASIVGRGTGVDDDVHVHKIHVVQQAIHRVQQEGIQPNQYLEQLGGLEIAAMAGFYLEAATQGVPVVIDGFIASAAALTAQHIEPDVTQWMLASHVSAETGHSLALNQLGLTPLLDFGLRLGEGSGAALILPLLQSAIALHKGMATFESASVSQGNDNEP